MIAAFLPAIVREHLPWVITGAALVLPWAGLVVLDWALRRTR